MTKQILRAAAMSVGLCVASVGLADASVAAEYSIKSQNLRPMAKDDKAASGIQVTITQSRGGHFSGTQKTFGGKAAFGEVPDGTHAVVISPAAGPAGVVGGLELTWTTRSRVDVTCEHAARRDNTFNCTITIVGGPVALTLTLLKR